jgi:hypothetical protein
MSQVPTSPDKPLVRESGGRLIAIPIAAGDTVTLSQRGTEFYLVVCTGSVNIRARGKNAGAGDFNEYPQQGTGNKSSSPFDFIDVQNPNAFAVVLAIWVGFDSYIDRRLILVQQTQYNVVYETSPVTESSTKILIPDISGGTFTDGDGNEWLAISRVALLVSNPDTAATIVLQSGLDPDTVPPFPGFYIYPQTSLNIGASGDFSISVGGGDINATVWEIYNAIAAT